MFYLTTHSTHFIYGYMASDIWLRTILIVRKETCCRHIGYSYRLTARVLLYAPSHRQDNTYHGLCYTSRGALAGTRILIKGSRELSSTYFWAEDLVALLFLVFYFNHDFVSISIKMCIEWSSFEKLWHSSLLYTFLRQFHLERFFKNTKISHM